MDGSFHSPEWHAARLASLKTSHTITWEEYKKKQKVNFLQWTSTLIISAFHIYLVHTAILLWNKVCHLSCSSYYST